MERERDDSWEQALLIVNHLRPEDAKALTLDDLAKKDEGTRAGHEAGGMSKEKYERIKRKRGLA